MMAAQLWEVVGGVEKGGVIVRTESELGSPAAEDRLSTGALVKELEYLDGRLHYELVSGTGPAFGWVTASVKGKDLLCKKPEVEQGKEEPQVSDDSTNDSDCDLPELYDATSDSGSDGKASQEEATAEEKPEPKEEKAPVQSKPEPKEAQEALRRYAQKFGQARDGEPQGYNRRAFPWYAGETHGEQATMELEELEALARQQPRREKRQARLWDVDSEGEQVTLCAHCLLPVGEVSYTGKDGKATSVHGECMAQIMLQEIKEKDVKRQAEDAEKKLKNHKEHSVGWSPERVPKNLDTAWQLGCSPVPQGLCCLVLDEASRTVRVASTHEPAAGVNLEYLMLALKVRYHACREPLFSLDPVNPENLETSMLEKRYAPSWLAGTSVGEVMFQADYFLKELSMGEHSMPVVGMHSVFDWSEADNVRGPWSGREWFVVKKAEVRISEDNTLIPHVKMGVEARTQVLGSNGQLEDSPITSKNHPLKKFAESVTKNFELIAERKSVVFHLRELAKASAMAKFLVDSGTSVPTEWWKVAEDLVKAAKPDQKEIPQLWNMRGQSRIQVRDGKLVNSETGQWSSLTGVYGGVEFGLDRFELAQRHTLRPVGAGGSTMVGGMQGMQLGPTGRPGFAPSRFQLTQRAVTPAPAEQPQGVDLNLDQFELSAPERFAGGLPSCSAGFDSLEGRVPLGGAFLASLRDSKSSFKSEDAKLLATVYSASLADRMDEGDAFVPPDPDLKYISKLRALVSEEQCLREKRRTRFCDRAFVPGNAGSDFPRSWTSNFQVEQSGLSPGLVKKALASGLVQLSLNAAFKKVILNDILPNATPEFDKVAEDGTAFRIYRLGSLEIRTIQEQSSPEGVAAVFSLRPTAWKAAPGKEGQRAAEGEKLVKARMYVEAIDGIADLTRSIQGKPAELAEERHALWQSQKLDHCNYYIVLETNSSNVAVTEKLADGSVSMVLNPENLEDRNSLARLLYTAECQEGTVSMREIKVFQASSERQTLSSATASDRKLYAKNLFKLASGKARLVRKSEKGSGKGRPHQRRQLAAEQAPAPAASPSSSRRTYSTTVNYGQ